VVVSSSYIDEYSEMASLDRSGKMSIGFAVGVGFATGLGLGLGRHPSTTTRTYCTHRTRHLQPGATRTLKADGQFFF
jgi:hypothetical protein